MSRLWLLFEALAGACGILFLSPLTNLTHLSLEQDDLSYIVLIPVLAAGLLFIERRSIFQRVSMNLWVGFPIALVAFGLAAATHWAQKSLSADVQLSLAILALWLLLIAAFAISFGLAALRAASFSLLYLLLMVPLPEFILNRVTYVLQAGSTRLTSDLFDLLRVPVLREGSVFHLPQFSIAIAKECSGIRSSMALLILALPIMHFGIRRSWKKATFLACAMLVMFMKNAIRIVSLTLLALYVDPSFLFGRLHRQGGVVFFLIGLLLLLPVYLALQDTASSGRNHLETADNSPAGKSSPSVQSLVTRSQD